MFESRVKCKTTLVPLVNTPGRRCVVGWRGSCVGMMRTEWEVWRRHFLTEKQLRSGFANAIFFFRNRLLRRGLRSLRCWSMRGLRIKRMEQRLNVGRRHYQKQLLQKCFSALVRFHFLTQQSLQEWRQRHLCAKGLGSWLRFLQGIREQSQAISFGAQIFKRKTNPVFFSNLRHFHSKQIAESDRLNLAQIFHSLVALKIGISRLRHSQERSSRSSIIRSRKILLQHHILRRQNNSLLHTVRLLFHRVNVKRIHFQKLLSHRRDTSIQSLKIWRSYSYDCAARRAFLRSADRFTVCRDLSITLRMQLPPLSPLTLPLSQER
jgi:hypothetical protein